MGFEHPTVSGRIGLRPNEMWNLGLSASEGAYLRGDALPHLPPGQGLGDYRQYVIGQDISFAWRHLQVWAEFHQAGFDIPVVGRGDTFSYFLEAKYKFAPQWFVALRWGQQFYSDVMIAPGIEVPWSPDIWRLEAAIAFRPTEYTQLKLQYYVQEEERVVDPVKHTFATQFTLRF
jgi:hypothetical protein